MIAGAGPMVKFVMAVLLFFSIFSWAIMIYKFVVIRKVERETARFYDLFWEKRQFAQIFAASKSFKATPLASLFGAVYNELQTTIKGSGEMPKVQKEDIPRYQRLLKKTGTTEESKLEYGVGFLATTGNTAPFIGLFGTVWGIMESFRSIGAKGAASLAVVAPGISEALVATAMGLLAAIPAVVGYNHILTRIGRITSEMDNFTTDLLNIVEKQAVKAKGEDAGGKG